MNTALAQTGTSILDAPVSEVTLYRHGAEIIRPFSATLKPGTNHLVLRGLPQSLVQQSLDTLINTQTEGVWLDGIVINNEPVTFGASEEQQVLKNEIESLSIDVRKNEDLIKSKELQLKLFDTLASGGLSLEDGVDMETLLESSRLIDDQAGDLLASVRQAEIAINALRETIEEKKRKLSTLGQTSRSERTAVISVHAQSESDIEGVIRYQVREAFWQPVYRIELQSQGKSVDLRFQAEIRQQSGENWNDIRLTLSSEQQSAAPAPDLHPWYISVREEREEMIMMDRAARGNIASAPLSLEEAGPAIATGIAVETGTFAASYEIEQIQSVPSGPGVRQITIADHAYQTELTWQSVPKIAAKAFVTASFELEGDLVLQPGPARLFRDGQFIGQSHTSLMRPGDRSEIAFGSDDNVEVRFHEDAQFRSTEGIIRNDRRNSRKYEIMVTNHHTFPIDVEIIEQLPVSQDERIRVELSRESTKPDLTNIDGRQGVIGWKREIEGQGQLKLDFGYAVIHDDELEVNNFYELLPR